MRQAWMSPRRPGPVAVILLTILIGSVLTGCGLMGRSTASRAAKAIGNLPRPDVDPNLWMYDVGAIVMIGAGAVCLTLAVFGKGPLPISGSAGVIGGGFLVGVFPQVRPYVVWIVLAAMVILILGVGGNLLSKWRDGRRRKEPPSEAEADG